MTSILSPDDRLKRFWETWWQEDYSWDNLASTSIPADHYVRRFQSGAPPNLQSYWRSPLERRQLRTDDEMRSELVEDPDGRQWHIVHVPMHWKDGTPAKAAWTGEQLDHLKSVINARLNHALSNEFIQEPHLRSIALLKGVVLPTLDFPAGKANAIFVQTYVGSKFSLQECFTESRFINCHFAQQVSLLNTAFHREAIFENCTFEGRICAQRVTCHEMASFCDSVFFGHNLFRECRFDGRTWFHHVQFEESVSFSGSHFSGEAQFNHASFRTGASFDGVLFDGTSDFDACSFGEGLSFRNARFAKPAFFSNVTLPAEVKPRDDLLSAADASFYNARFSDTAIFTGTILSPLASFNGCLFDGGLHVDRAPEGVETNRFRSELQEALSAADKDAKLDALLGGAQTIRKSMERASDKKSEHLFYRFELMVRQKQNKTPPAERALLWAYGYVSDYGSSVAKPLLNLILVLCSFGLVYALILGFSAGQFDMSKGIQLTETTVSPLAHGFSYSAGRVFPFAPWELDKTVQRELIGSSGTFSAILVRALATVQSLMSVILFFLAALAVRRRFQIG